MKPLKPSISEYTSISRSISLIQLAGPLKESTFQINHKTKVGAFCLLCPEKRCLSTKNDFGQVIELCPVGAISLHGESSSIEISDSCISCGLCAVVCPIGAIQIKKTGIAALGRNEFPINLERANSSQWEEWIKDKISTPNMTMLEIKDTANFLASRCTALKGNIFYKTVESLLRLLGYDARMSNLGDTSNRIDLIINSKNGNIPVEIKSYAETPAINWKSIQQAVENKLLISRLDGDSIMTPLSSLVIGYSYPSERTGIEKHINEIERAFGIRVGIVSLGRIWELILEKYCSNVASKQIDLAGFSGIL